MPQKSFESDVSVHKTFLSERINGRFFFKIGLNATKRSNIKL
jgi:hypothetical protein